jgi:hypothetical protein
VTPPWRPLECERGRRGGFEWTRQAGGFKDRTIRQRHCPHALCLSGGEDVVRRWPIDGEAAATTDAGLA